MIDFTKDAICVCGTKLDFFGNHSLACMDRKNGVQNKLRSRSHTMFKFQLIEILRNHFISNSSQFRILDEHKEPLISKFFALQDNSKVQDEDHKDYRGDFAIENRDTGEIEVIDVTIAASTAATYDKYNSNVGEAADNLELNKRRKYDNIISKELPQQCRLFIFAIENNGGLAKNAKEFCRRMAKLAEDSIHSLHQLYAEISILMQKIINDQIYDIVKHYSKPFISNQLLIDSSLSQRRIECRM